MSSTENNVTFQYAKYAFHQVNMINTKRRLSENI